MKTKVYSAVVTLRIVVKATSESEAALCAGDNLRGIANLESYRVDTIIDPANGTLFDTKTRKRIYV